MDIVSSIFFISCPSLRKCSENLDLPSAYLKFFLCSLKQNFNTRFKEHRKDFRYAEDKSKFSENVLNEGHELKTIEETMSIIHLENNLRKINKIEEIKILKAASSKYLFNDVIAGQTSLHINNLNSKINSLGQATNKI